LRTNKKKKSNDNVNKYNEEPLDEKNQTRTMKNKNINITSL